MCRPTREADPSRAPWVPGRHGLQPLTQLSAAGPGLYTEDRSQLWSPRPPRHPLSPTRSTRPKVTSPQQYSRGLKLLEGQGPLRSGRPPAKAHFCSRCFSVKEPPRPTQSSPKSWRSPEKGWEGNDPWSPGTRGQFGAVTPAWQPRAQLPRRLTLEAKPGQRGRWAERGGCRRKIRQSERPLHTGWCRKRGHTPATSARADSRQEWALWWASWVMTPAQGCGPFLSQPAPSWRGLPGVCRLKPLSTCIVRDTGKKHMQLELTVGGGQVLYLEDPPQGGL